MKEIHTDDNKDIGTEIFDPQLPSNIDFDQNSEIGKISPKKIASPLKKITSINTNILSYSIKGKVTF